MDDIYTHQNLGEILREDESYIISHNTNYAPDKGNGFLEALVPSASGWRRLAPIGGYELRLSGLWEADIHAVHDPETDSDAVSLGDYRTREEAVAALWEHRLNY